MYGAIRGMVEVRSPETLNTPLSAGISPDAAPPRRPLRQRCKNAAKRTERGTDTLTPPAQT